jgi:hypothetical protein
MEETRIPKEAKLRETLNLLKEEEKGRKRTLETNRNKWWWPMEV